MKKLTFLLFTCFISFASESQITVDQSYTIEQYVNDILLGSGVQAFNVTYTGADMQIGLLQNGDGTLFPMSEGLVLSCANAGALDNDFEGFDTDIPFGEGVSGDQDLLDIANSVPGLIGQNFTVSSINDLCVLEFDFIATGDSVKFNYAFGSDEYLTWVNSTYNDIFAFFLSGPGITGPYDSPAGFPNGSVNIAQVPNSDPPLPITISSVNDVLNQDYYIDNQSNTALSLNGFTVLLEASHAVECGEIYHIKLAIADGSDNILESVVVLETGSFTSNSVVQVDLEIDVGGPDANIIYEDCGIATFTFTRPIETILDIEEMVFINYGGTATEGVDYNFLPDTIIFAPFVESVSFTIDAFEDGIIEGLELVQMEILNLAACNGGGLTSYFEFSIADFPEPLVVEDYGLSMCYGDTTELIPEIYGGYGNYNYEWSTGETTSSIFVYPETTTSYNIIVSDTCGMPSDDGDIELEILVFDPLTVFINGGDITLDCGDFVELTATVSGGNQEILDWEWTDQFGNTMFGLGNTLFLSTWDGASEVTVSVTDACGFTASNTINIELNVPELFVVSDDVQVACDEDVEACVTASGGDPGYFYTWYLNNTVDWMQWDNCFNGAVNPGDVLMVEVSDNCGQIVQEVINLQFPVTDLAVTLQDSYQGTCVDEFVVVPEVSGGNGSYIYQWSNGSFNLGGGTPLTFTPGETITVQVLITDECGYQASDETTITITNPAALVDIPEEILVSCIDTTLIVPVEVVGIEDITYSWIIDEEEVGTGTTLNWQTLEDETVQLNIVDACGSEANDQVMLVINDTPVIVTATADQIICSGESAEITVIAEGGVGPYTYFWHSLNSTNVTEMVSPDITTTYEVAATDVCGQFDLISTTVTISPIAINYYFNMLSDNEYQFGAVVFPECDEGCQFSWDFGDGETSTLENPIHTYTSLETFEGSVTVVNQIGCSASMDFEIEPPAMVYIPGAFSPNGDGINDVFRVYGAGIESFEIIIFNRWGQVVYQSQDLNEVWVGEITDRFYYAENESYNYVVTVKGFDVDAITKRGTLTVIR